MAVLSFSGGMIRAQPSPNSNPSGSTAVAIPEPAPPPLGLNQRAIIERLEARWRAACASLQTRQTVSLQGAIQAGLLNNPVLSKTYAELQSSQWQVIAVRREWFPLLAMNNPVTPPWALATESNVGNQSDQKTGMSTTNAQHFYTSPRVRLEWTFLDPTRTPRLKSSLALSRSQQLLFDISARDLVLDIQMAYFSLQEAKELREDYERIYGLTREQIRKARMLRRNGIGEKGDLDQLRSQLLQQLVQLIDLYQQELIAANQLAYTMSLPPGELLAPSERMWPIPAWTTPLPQTIAGALELREEIRSSLARADSAAWLARARLNRYLPLATLLTQTQLNTDSKSSSTTANGSSSWTQQNSNYINNAVGLSFNWMMFDGGIAAADSSSQASLSESNRAQADAWRYLITLQVQNSHATYVASDMVIDTALEQVRSARQTVDYTSRYYNGTTIDATTYIQNIQNYLNAARSYHASLKRYNIAVSSLFRYSAQWPMASYADLQQRLPTLKRQ